MSIPVEGGNAAHRGRETHRVRTRLDTRASREPVLASSCCHLQGPTPTTPRLTASKCKPPRWAAFHSANCSMFHETEMQ